MKSNLFLIGLIILSLNPLWAQPQTTKLKEDESSVILKEIQQKLISLHSAEINFSLQTVKEGKTINSTKGQLWIKGDKYKLIIPSQHVYCDSINVWNYLPEQNEVNISLYDPQDDEIAINPIKLIANYKKYYRSAFVREFVEKGVTIQIIDLYPLQNSAFFKVRLYIEKNKKEITKTSISEFDGYTYTYSFDSFIKNPKLSNQLFIFNTSQYQNIEIIDLR
ncbi:MAG: outer membrane lipoprotein carrier protein LolA [Bacteroidales bacterium]|jgi:outer membrane lipoprotein-sorting protein|nr:outer membrane lipoprotein carrier protein LolA [Bacteroidales bacterium]MDD3329877.1 outer membrane lipoprotein carrier protein LolA [Bacteroidales bacterium]MDD3690741.1 outer membrane lipoprotein carrier protein LolA [Bacteroidales bacterium]MDD4044010.1 outer membrane lipoprotein carrier protein LolA [Bacteroidales bacterium]MDD4581061.1 outer membrane lipoprotein carrier protein LolA [Bacteroidales bacterium]